MLGACVLCILVLRNEQKCKGHFSFHFLSVKDTLVLLRGHGKGVHVQSI